MVGCFGQFESALKLIEVGEVEMVFIHQGIFGEGFVPLLLDVAFSFHLVDLSLEVLKFLLYF